MKIAEISPTLPTESPPPAASPLPLPPPARPPNAAASRSRLRALEQSRNRDFSGWTGGPWDILPATDFRSDHALANAFLRQINNSTAAAAAALNAANNAAGLVLADAPRALEEAWVAAGGPSFQELAVAARSATPGMPLDELACGGLAWIARLSHRARLKVVPPKLRLGPRAFRHIRQRHLDGWPAELPKSLFFLNEDPQKLLLEAAKVPRMAQRGGNYERVVQASRYVGIDRRTREPTSAYTVITTPADEIVTMFPGRP